MSVGRPRGRFIVLEGADGVGSTTQCLRLVDGLQCVGVKTHLTAEPSRGPIGVMIRQMLCGDRARQEIHRELALLFAADRLDHVAREVEPLLAEGVWVVCDRYVLSSLVYQSLDLELPWVEMLNREAPAPDATVLIELPLDEALARIRARGGKAEIFDQADTQRRVHDGYARLAARQGAARVDGSGRPDEVSERVVAALQQQGAWPS